jgi:hypothetical protein
MWARWRLAAGYSSDEALAESWGRSVRQMRRWRSGETPAPVWAWRLLRYEAGVIPGWPRGWRAAREGVVIPGLGLAGLAEIEARGWVWQLVRDDLRPHAMELYERFA